MTHEDLVKELFAALDRYATVAVPVRELLAPILARHPELDPGYVREPLKDLVEPPPETPEAARLHAEELERLARIREAGGAAPI
jgi:hypothetical protein